MVGVVAVCAASNTEPNLSPDPTLTKILVTGGAGFIGSNFVRMMLAETDHQLVNLDLLTYAGNLCLLYTSDAADE